MTSKLHYELEFPWTDTNAPPDTVGMAFVSSKRISSISTRIFWEFHDLVVAFGMLQQTLRERDKMVQEKTDKLKKMQLEPDDDEEMFNVMRSRVRESIRAEHLMMAQIARTSVRSIIVNSWILAESTLGQTYSVLSKSQTGSKPSSTSYRWDQFVAQFQSLGITLSDLPSYEAANLCRIVNNGIKHDGNVSNQMAKSNQFSGCKGKNLRAIDIEPQPLVTGVHSFCMGLSEAVEKKLKPSSFE